MFRFLRSSLCVIGLLAVVPLTRAQGQQAVPPPPAGAPSSVVQSSKSIWTGLAITVIACGLGVFVVVKSSSRN
jgi:hypothetical protein